MSPYYSWLFILSYKGMNFTNETNIAGPIGDLERNRVSPHPLVAQTHNNGGFTSTLPAASVCS